MFILAIILIISHAIVFMLGRYIGSAEKCMSEWANLTDCKHKDFDPKGGLNDKS